MERMGQDWAAWAQGKFKEGIWSPGASLGMDACGGIGTGTILGQQIGKP